MAIDDFLGLSGLDLSAWYFLHAHEIDALVYFIFFTGLARYAVGDRFGGRGGQAMAVAVGVALSFGAVVFAGESGFTLGDLGLYAWMLFLIVLALAGYRVMRGMGFGRWTAIPATFLLVIGLRGVAGHAISDALIAIGLGWVLPLALLGSIVALAIRVLLGDSRKPASHVRSESRRPNPPLHSAKPTGNQDRLLLMTTLARVLENKGCDADAKSFLLRLQSVPREIESLLSDIERRLESFGWGYAGNDKRLVPAVEELITGARRNIQSHNDHFKELARAIGQSEAEAALNHVSSLIQIERQAGRICRELRAVISRLDVKKGDAARS
ncbi:MAG: hypothetical protein KDA31_07245 [Phycisphaerales bacterium]|nr:hypothetical protein [Phycisphaerales bacterium]